MKNHNYWFALSLAALVIISPFGAINPLIALGAVILSGIFFAIWYLRETDTQETTEGVVDMEQTFYVGMKICDYYAVHINDNGYEQKEMVQENEIDGFVHCLKVLGYKEI